MKITSIFSKALKGSKKTKALVLVLVAVAFPALSLVQAQQPVVMEGHTKSLNVTAGQTAYGDSTDAMVDDVVQVQMWHHNRELPDGAKATNTKAKFAIPTQQGKTQVITGTTTSDNGNTVSDTTTVNLSLERARIEFIPGTAKFRYNKGAQDGNPACQTGMNYPPESCYATVAISDEVVRGGVNLDAVRGGPLNGCNAYHETVTVQVRVKADVVSVNKYARHVGQGANDWKTSITAKPGDNIEYMIRFKNEGNTRLDDVAVGDNMPKYVGYVNGTTKLKNGVNPNGTTIPSDNLTKGGINTGNYMPGAVGYVWFTAKIDPLQAYEKCNTTYDTRNVGIVRPKGMNDHYNTAQVNIQVDCKDAPKSTYSCDLLKAEVGQNRKVKFTTSASASGGATIKRYVYNFGDGSEEFTTTNSTTEHTYAKDGQYVAQVRVEMQVNGETKVAESESCKAPVKFTTTPTTPGQPGTPGVPTSGTLPETGAGSVAAVFAAVTVAGTLGYSVVARRMARG